MNMTHIIEASVIKSLTENTNSASYIVHKLPVKTFEMHIPKQHTRLNMSIDAPLI